MTIDQTEVKFTIEISDISEAAQFQAEHKAREAYIMELLRQHHLSPGRAAELLSLDRWQLLDLMTIYQISPFPEQTQAELEHEVGETLKLLESGDR